MYFLFYSHLHGLFVQVDSNFQRTDRVGGKFHPDNVGDAFVDIDAMDMSDGMQEAMHRSHLDMRYK